MRVIYTSKGTPKKFGVRVIHYVCVNELEVHDQTAHRQVHWIQIQTEDIRPHTNTDI
jgi:hypothetical protein